MFTAFDERRTTLIQEGFTIVELLIVIVVIAILASISVVAYNGVQAKAGNSKMAAYVRNYLTAVEAAKATDGRYPILPGESPAVKQYMCLSSGNTGGKCGKVDGNDVLENQTVINAMQTSSGITLPKNTPAQAITNEDWIGLIYGIDSVGSPAPHTGYGRVLIWHMKGDNQNCLVARAYSFASGSGNTACEILLEPTA